MAKRSSELIQKRLMLLKEGERLRDQTLESYRQIDQQLVVKPTDTWSAVVAKATSLRQLGRTTESVAAFTRYGELFAEADPGAPRYTRTAQQFTLQLGTLGVQGGVYIHEAVKGGAAAKAGLLVGDIVIDYGGHVISDMGTMVSAVRDAPAGDPLRLVYLRMNDSGVFQRQTVSVLGGPLGAGYMPI
jgi:S1-C subfamily serine protease